MSATQLLQMLVDAGLNVRQVEGWKTRGGAWSKGKPVGLMQHHTAAPVPFPVDRLYGSLLKCNWNSKPNGEIWLVAYGACNYSSGGGLSTVLQEVLAGTPPAANARDRGYTADDDDTDGNPLFWNGEHDHYGHGEPIPDVQHRAIIVASRVFNTYWGLTAGQTISHAEWTSRKTDPYWNSDRRCIEAIRTGLEDDMPLTDDDIKRIWAAAPQPGAQKQAGQVLLEARYWARKSAGQTTADIIRDVIADLDLPEATADELVRRLAD